MAYLLFVAFPVLFSASLISRRMPWWQWNPLQEWLQWLSLFLFLCFSVFTLLRAKRWAVFILGAFAAFITLALLYTSLRQENVALGLFSIALGIAAFAYIERLWAAFQFPALAPGIRWFQSLPEPIPGLALQWGETKGLRLSQLDLGGGFILGQFLKGSEKNLPSEVTLHYRGSKVTCGVNLVSALSSKINTSWAGIGVEFKNTDLDSKKDLADFIEVLRGEGHVIT